MNLRKVLGPDVVRSQLSSKTKTDAINELLGILVATGKVKDEEAARTALFERERKMSTGMQHGIAIPHGKTEAVDALIACVGVSRAGIDFESLDREPARIFIMTLSPRNRTGPHIQFLAEVSELLKSRERREAMLQASAPDELLRILTS
ncbi:MAG: PTS sugar transporter subunit IIA [Spirochaetaceae bacterium]|nr:PTS sugar transporter subunit IIA [Spirochaetaceae bacterium]